MAAQALGDESDRELVARFLASQDEAVFEALVRRHGPMVYRVPQSLAEAIARGRKDKEAF
jgi:hypothetical protein